MKPSLFLCCISLAAFAAAEAGYEIPPELGRARHPLVCGQPDPEEGAPYRSIATSLDGDEAIEQGWDLYLDGAPTKGLRIVEHRSDERGRGIKRVTLRFGAQTVTATLRPTVDAPEGLRRDGARYRDEAGRLVWGVGSGWTNSVDDEGRLRRYEYSCREFLQNCVEPRTCR